jgi:hypothetical protein
MRPFESELRRVAAALDLPQPQRIQILEEIAEDLNELRIELIRRGAGEAEAERRAIEILAPSDLAVRALVGVHEPLYDALARRFSSSEMRRFERGGLLAATLVAIGIVARALVAEGIVGNPSPLLLPILFLFIGVVVLAGRKGVQLFLEGDHDPEGLREGMKPILVGSGLAVALAAAGGIVELAFLAARLEASPEAAALLVVPWLRDVAVLVGAGIATALLGGLFWALLLEKVVAVEEAYLREERIVGRGDPEPSPSLQGR